MSDDEREPFQMNEWDFAQPRRKMTKEQQIYGNSSSYLPINIMQLTCFITLIHRISKKYFVYQLYHTLNCTNRAYTAHEYIKFLNFISKTSDYVYVIALNRDIDCRYLG